MYHEGKHKRILAMQPLFGSWMIDGFIGKGKFGQVYRIKREVFGKKQTAALKWVPIPAEDEAMLFAGYDHESIKRRLANCEQEFEREITLMSILNKSPNIVAYEDHLLLRRDDVPGYDLLIRMELLTPLPERLEKPYTAGDVIQLGIDICKGLALCQKNRIIHRDIKPDNLFVGSDGIYKLGDFGVARQLSESISNMSKKGTPAYIAPEVYLAQPYDQTVDTYSLGLVLHRLFNKQRMPLASQSSTASHSKDWGEAFRSRIGGAEIPSPVDGYNALNRVLAKATAYNPRKRYQTAEQMLKALTALQRNKKKMQLVLGPPKNPPPKPPKKPPKRKGSELLIAALIGIVLILIIIVAIIAFM